jgi:peptidoglycan hydrolase-like protein with peptidoglycan-binding domain
MIIYFGCSGRNVRCLQTVLNQINLVSGRYQAQIIEDGVFGKKTDMGLRNLQAALGIKVDGILGPATCAAVLSLQTADGMNKYKAKAALR